MKATNLIALGTSLFITAGCGGGGGAATGPMPPTADTTAPTVLSSVPLDGAGPVSLKINPEIVVSEALNASSVNDNTVILSDVFGNEPEGVLEYDTARNAIVFTPETRLTNGRDYTFTVNGVTDHAGNAMASTSVSFRTYGNPLRQNIGYRNGVAIIRIDYESNDRGLINRRITYGAGPDTALLTGDDVVTRYSDSEFDATGLDVSEVLYNGPGADQIWFTGDDDSDPTQFVVIYDADNRRVGSERYNGRGPDGVWFTDDDVLSEYTRTDVDETGTRIDEFSVHRTRFGSGMADR